MVDRAGRDRYAEILRHFASGRMTNSEYDEATEELALGSEDRAMSEIWLRVWLFYDDLHEHRLTDRRYRDPRVRREIARFVLFLQSDQEFSWPVDQGFESDFPTTFYFLCGFLACVAMYALGNTEAASLGLGAVVFLTTFLLVREVRRRSYARAGDINVWPFLNHADLDAARRHPRLLAGR